MRQGQVAPRPVRLDEVVLDDPVHFGTKTEGILLQVRHYVFPHLERALLEGREAAALGEAQRARQVFGLDLDGRELASVRESYAPATRDVVADLADCPDRVLQRQVAPRRAVLFEHPEDDRSRAHLQERRVL